MIYFGIGPTLIQFIGKIVGSVSSVGRAQGVGLRDSRFWSQPGRRRVPHVQLKLEMLRLHGADVERRVSRIYK